MSTPFIAPAYVRSYTEKPKSKPASSKRDKCLDEPSDWSLVFDTETTVDAAQALRVGVFQVRKGAVLHKEGLFYDPKTLTQTDRSVLECYAEDRNLLLCTIKEFRRKIFLRVGYKARASIIGFNLPFDLSRIALDWGEARGSLRGGFSFRLTNDRCDPAVRVKHLSSTAALTDFAKPKGQDAGRGQRRRGESGFHHRGYFIDLRTTATALLSRKHSLASLCEALGVETQKKSTDEHGGPLTPTYLDYARVDVQATWECFQVLQTKYAEHGLRKPLHRILSEASIGKAYLEAMDVEPFLACQPDASRAGFGRLMSAYYGGRAEARIRRTPVQVFYADFKSMYPTVNALMELSRFLTANSYEERDTTEETQVFLEALTLEDMRNKATWSKLVTLIQLKPDGDLLPFRTKYSDDKQPLTIGLNHVESATPLWYSLADVAASKILTGKTPHIELAITFKPAEKQAGLKPINLFGNPEYRVDSNTDDMFTRLVDLRDAAKRRKDPIQKAIKIIANATCYGIFVEVQRDDAPKPESLMIYGPDGEGMATCSKALEQPGTYFNPLLAVMITGAARLMLALTERVAADRGLGYAFCDTDSLAMAKPDGMADAAFFSRAQSVIDWFEPLNPYAKPGSILQAEDANYLEGQSDPHPLYCLTISAKRYALFNVNAAGDPVLRKASAHGLGHLIEPYSVDDPAPGIPAPSHTLSEIGVKQWQHDLWWMLCEAALEGDIDRMRYDWHLKLQKPALSRYGATSPIMLRWMQSFNDSKPYCEQVKPFGFLTAPLARTGVFASIESEIIFDPTRRGRPRKQPAPKPIAPFERDSDIAVSKAFDRETGDPISRDLLKTFEEALCLYHRSPEDKFDHGGPWDKGLTQRRRILVSMGRKPTRLEKLDKPIRW